MLRTVYILLCLTLPDLSSSVCPLNAFSSIDYYLPGVNRTGFVVTGDINIGSLVSITDDNHTERCFKIVRPDLWALQNIEAIVYAVDLVNRNPHILPNISMGFVMLDYCRSTNVALAQSLAFLPLKTTGPDSSFDVQNSSLSWSSTDETIHYDVIGALSTYGSSSTIPISYLYSVARLPMVGTMVTGDELSDKSLHPYFMRVIPPDKVQVRAILTFIANYKWSYISVIYSEGTYGETAYRTIENLASEFSICVATSHRTHDNTDYIFVVKDLLNHKNARVVIIFAGVKIALGLMGASEALGAKGQFIWLASDSVSDKILEKHLYYEELYGSFTFMYYYKRIPQFDDYFNHIPINASKNPWLKPFWERHASCSFVAGTCQQDTTFSSLVGINVPSSASLTIDSVMTFANAAHRLIEDHCPGATGKEARSCIKGEILLKYMLNSSFDGYTGKIEFNSQGNLLGKYAIRQIKRRQEINVTDEVVPRSQLVEAPVGIFEVSSRQIIFNGYPISWSHLKKVERIVPIIDTNISDDFPESVCSRPCVLREYKIVKDAPCCWECRRCRTNERLVARSTNCEACPRFSWPDPSTNFTTCRAIPLTHASVSNTLSLILVCLAAIAIIGQILVASAYIHYRKTKVIKAASRELSILQMAAMLVGYMAVILFQTTPTHQSCGALYFMFCLSFAWLYSPLIVKAVRIYRIFANSSKCNRRPRFISPQSQIVMAASLIAIQVLLCITTYSLRAPTATKTQPVVVESYVELSCDLTLPGLTSFLTYNLILVTVCAIFAFKTRKLPDNFNESWFMFMCVSTTLVIWSAIVPTYFTTNRESARTLLLSVTLLLNHTVALVFLFIPKIYAALCVPPDEFVVSRFHTNANTNHVTNLQGQVNRVTPFRTSPRRQNSDTLTVPRNHPLTPETLTVPSTSSSFVSQCCSVSTNKDPSTSACVNQDSSESAIKDLATSASVSQSCSVSTLKDLSTSTCVTQSCSTPEEGGNNHCQPEMNHVSPVTQSCYNQETAGNNRCQPERNHVSPVIQSCSNHDTAGNNHCQPERNYVSPVTQSCSNQDTAGNNHCQPEWNHVSPVTQSCSTPEEGGNNHCQPEWNHVSPVTQSCSNQDTAGNNHCQPGRNHVSPVTQSCSTPEEGGNNHCQPEWNHVSPVTQSCYNQDTAGNNHCQPERNHDSWPDSHKAESKDSSVLNKIGENSSYLILSDSDSKQDTVSFT